jgi:hypothetical protein
MGLPVALSRAVFLHQDWWDWAEDLPNKQGRGYKNRRGDWVRGELDAISVLEYAWQQCWGQGTVA